MQASNWDMSHGMLIAVLMHNGGSYDLPADAVMADAIGNRAGELHAMEILPLPGGGVRLSVVAKPQSDPQQEQGEHGA